MAATSCQAVDLSNDGSGAVIGVLTKWVNFATGWRPRLFVLSGSVLRCVRPRPAAASGSRRPSLPFTPASSPSPAEGSYRRASRTAAGPPGGQKVRKGRRRWRGGVLSPPRPSAGG